MIKVVLNLISIATVIEISKMKAIFCTFKTDFLTLAKIKMGMSEMSESVLPDQPRIKPLILAGRCSAVWKIRIWEQKAQRQNRMLLTYVRRL